MVGPFLRSEVEMSQNSKLLQESSLQTFFFEQLQEFNKRSTRPLEMSFIYYSSLVMDHLGDSSKYFEVVDDKIKEKVLGVKLLESSLLSKEKQKATLRDIAETSLMLCGFFHDSLNNKMIDVRYYEDIGKIAYSRLNSFSPTAFDVPSFYKRMSQSFSDLTLLMNLVSKNYQSNSDPDLPWLILKGKTFSQ